MTESLDTILARILGLDESRSTKPNRTLDEAFMVFLKRLTPNKTESLAAKRHRESIEKAIRAKLGLNRIWRTGSFGNGTSISGYSDVDMMASIPRKSLTQNSVYTLNKLRTVLDNRFPRTGVRVSSPAVVVPFGKDPSESTEVTPGDYLGKKGSFKYYDIPDGNGGWINASPDAHNDYVKKADKKLLFKVRPLIRCIKAWKYYNNVPISSFYLELRVAKYACGEDSILYPVDIHAVFSELHRIGLAAIQDPKGISGRIPACRSAATLVEAKSKLKQALTRAAKAQKAKDEGRISKAFAWWDKVYNGRFPSARR